MRQTAAAPLLGIALALGAVACNQDAGAAECDTARTLWTQAGEDTIESHDALTASNNYTPEARRQQKAAAQDGLLAAQRMQNVTADSPDCFTVEERTTTAGLVDRAQLVVQNLDS